MTDQRWWTYENVIFKTDDDVEIQVYRGGEEGAEALARRVADALNDTVSPETQVVIDALRDAIEAYEATPAGDDNRMTARRHDIIVAARAVVASLDSEAPTDE